MTDEPVPADIRDFIQRHMDSVAQVEALLLVRSTPDAGWDVTSVARRLYVGEKEIAEVLARLCADGILTCRQDLYRYECEIEMQHKIDLLAQLYSSHLIPITNLIHAKPRRIREFANAFRFRREA